MHFRWKDIRSFGRRTFKNWASIGPFSTSSRRPCASCIAMATFWKCSRKKQGRRANGCAACVCHALHSGGAHSCAACVSLFMSPFAQQDSKTRAAVLLTHALDKWLLVTSQLFARVEKMLRPKRTWTLHAQVTANSPVGLNHSTWHENDNTC